MKILVTKAVSNDEQLQATVEGRDAEDIAPKLAEVLALLDARNLLVCNRVVDAMKQSEELPPAVRQLIGATMGILYGRPGAMQEMAIAREHLASEDAERAAKTAGTLPPSQGSLRAVDADAAVSE